MQQTLHSSIRLHGVILNHLSPGIKLPFTFTLDLKFRTQCVDALLSGMLGRADGFAVHGCVLHL
jgi:hypothetical protein